MTRREDKGMHCPRFSLFCGWKTFLILLSYSSLVLLLFSVNGMTYLLGKRMSRSWKNN